ncbi:hypothetical protein [Bradyrhizobium sp. HKCCYLS20291]|uniref:hypothetical protein n=1 Tax=Bradyrhizobium sp. HKCCYLS20291 TaxID=3420766 RepID=UPI003EB83613
MGVEAMRAYAEEPNRLNRERRASADRWRDELMKVEQRIQGLVEAVRSAKMRLRHTTREAIAQLLSAIQLEIGDERTSGRSDWRRNRASTK